jgi:hypothetical protein
MTVKQLYDAWQNAAEIPQLREGLKQLVAKGGVQISKEDFANLKDENLKKFVIDLKIPQVERAARGGGKAIDISKFSKSVQDNIMKARQLNKVINDALVTEKSPYRIHVYLHDDSAKKAMPAPAVPK